MEELKQQLLKGTFYYYKVGLLVKGDVNSVLEVSKDTLNISFNCGTAEVHTDKVKFIRRPANIVASFEWCYMLKNEYEEIIGYIGKVVC